MPAFIKTPADEKRWSKAKDAANKTHSESEGDSYWAVVNSIYQKMNKAVDLALELGDEESLSKVITMLEKADDESDDNDNDLGEGFSEFDPDAEESDEDNDPKQGTEYEEYGDGEDEEAHRKNIEDDESAEEIPGEEDEAGEEPASEMPKLSEKELAGMPKAVRDIYLKSQSKGGQPQKVEEAAAPEEVKRSTRFRQPSPEEIQHMRTYTRPWEQRTRDITKLKAEAAKNPNLHHQGQIIEAREKAHGDRTSEYQKMINSDDYKNADPIQQMDMDDNFERDWKQKNPEHLKNALAEHHEADQKGRAAKAQFDAAKDANIRNAIQGGTHSPEAMSTEEGLQHVGGVKGEEGTTGTITSDPAASFANNNPEFIKDFAEKYNKKGPVPEVEEDYGNMPEKDIASILGPAKAKDPKVEAFFNHYYPLLGMSKAKVLKTMGLDAKNSDIDHEGLHGAGMQGLFQAINDYDHEHPSKASFATHAGNKIRGLMQTHLREQDKIPVELRRAQKTYQKTKAPPVKNIMSGGQASPAAPAPTVRPSKEILSAHPKAADIQERLGHNKAARASVIVRKKPPGRARIMGISKTTTNAVFPAWNVEQEDSPSRYAPIPTPASLRNSVLFGIPLRSFLTGQEVTDDAIQTFINQAISEIEHEFDIYITPCTFTENQDYSRAMNFWSFGYVKLNHSPILNVSKFELTFNNGINGLPPLVDIPLEYVYVQPQEGTVQLVPAQGISISGLIVSIYSGLGFHAFNSQMLNHWPGAVRITYSSGFELNKIPAMIVGLIENLAAFKMLSVMGPILFPHNSVSIGIDGTSQSVGTLGPNFLQTRLADLEKIIGQNKEAMKGYYQKRFLVDYI